MSTTWNQSILESKDAKNRLIEAKNRLLENPPPTKSDILRKLSAAAGNSKDELISQTRSSQRLLLLKASPRKALASVSNILLDPNSYQAHQVIRNNINNAMTSLTGTRSSDAVLQSSSHKAVSCRRGELGATNKFGEEPKTVCSTTSLNKRHHLFAQVSSISLTQSYLLLSHFIERPLSVRCNYIIK